MKKVTLLTALLVLLTVGAYSQDAANQNSVTGQNPVYRNIQVYKVYSHPDAYVVMYHIDGVTLGQVTLPSEWFDIGNDKGVLRMLDGQFSPYMLLQYTDGVFTKVILTMPKNRGDIAWGVINNTVDTKAGSQTDTLILE